ncbi:MAG: (p)ppGpp synthetase, partial [Clostridiales bacterium]|nr:(p)ppGpp synthetase [Clostridiales bacterium]
MTNEQYHEFIQSYEDAKQILLTRLDVLNHNLYGESSSKPIHHIQHR